MPQGYKIRDIGLAFIMIRDACHNPEAIFEPNLSQSSNTTVFTIGISWYRQRIETVGKFAWEIGFDALVEVFSGDQCWGGLLDFVLTGRVSGIKNCRLGLLRKAVQVLLHSSIDASLGRCENEIITIVFQARLSCWTRWGTHVLSTVEIDRGKSMRRIGNCNEESCAIAAT